MRFGRDGQNRTVITCSQGTGLSFQLHPEFGGYGASRTPTSPVQTERAPINTTHPHWGDWRELNSRKRSHNPLPSHSATATLGAGGGARNPTLRFTGTLLCLLSYASKLWRCLRDLNPWSPVRQTGGIPASPKHRSACQNRTGILRLKVSWPDRLAERASQNLERDRRVELLSLVWKTRALAAIPTPLKTLKAPTRGALDENTIRSLRHVSAFGWMCRRDCGNEFHFREFLVAATGFAPAFEGYEPSV